AFHFDRPRIRLEVGGVVGRIFLAGSELVKIVEAEHDVRRRRLFVHAERALLQIGQLRTGEGHSGRSRQSRGQESPAVDVNVFRREIGIPKFGSFPDDHGVSTYMYGIAVPVYFIPISLYRKQSTRWSLTMPVACIN